MAENTTDKEILVPKDYTDAIFENPHQTVKGESVVSCNMVLRNPQTLVGTQVTCPNCTRVFDVKQGGA